MVYPYGCEQIKDLVLLLGQLLDNMGCDCILDLVTDQEVQNEGDRDLFVMKKLDTLQKEDFVIFIHYEGNFCSIRLGNCIGSIHCRSYKRIWVRKKRNSLK